LSINGDIKPAGADTSRSGIGIPARKVTVWISWVFCCQSTVSPTCIYSVAGKKAITSLARERFSAPTTTVYVCPELANAGDGIARLVAENKKDSITIKLNIGNRFIDFLLLENRFFIVRVIFKIGYIIPVNSIISN
jgi:hypothetical protein